MAAACIHGSCLLFSVQLPPKQERREQRQPGQGSVHMEASADALDRTAAGGPPISRSDANLGGAQLAPTAELHLEQDTAKGMGRDVVNLA